MAKTWFITGASRGFGRVWAQAALERGDSVVATARDASTLDELVRQHNLDLHLGQEVDDVFRTPVELRMALLASEALGLGDGDALQAHFLQRFLHLVQLERLDDRFDLFHVLDSLARYRESGLQDPCQFWTAGESRGCGESLKFGQGGVVRI